MGPRGQNISYDRQVLSWLLRTTTVRARLKGVVGSDLAEVKGVGRRDKDQLRNPLGEGRASSPSGSEPGTVWIVFRGVFYRGCNRGDAKLGFFWRGAGIMASGFWKSLEICAEFCICG